MDPKQALEALYNVVAQVALNANQHAQLQKCRDVVAGAISKSEEPKAS